MIVKRKGYPLPFCVMTRDGSRLLGCHKTRKEAEAQLAAIHISQARRKRKKGKR